MTAVDAARVSAAEKGRELRESGHATHTRDDHPGALASGNRGPIAGGTRRPRHQTQSKPERLDLCAGGGYRASGDSSALEASLRRTSRADNSSSVGRRMRPFEIAHLARPMSPVSSARIARRRDASRSTVVICPRMPSSASQAKRRDANAGRPSKSSSAATSEHWRTS
jgi:hypothetical protein